MNKVILTGYLGQNPKICYGPQGNIVVANVSLATKRRIKNENVTDWHSLVIFGKLAEIADKHLKQGKRCTVVGRLTYRTWQDKSGKNNKVAEVIVDELEILDWEEKCKQ